MKVGQLVYRDPKDLHQHPHNPRKISKEDFARLVDSIRDNGFWVHRPEALEEIDGKLYILCGNQRNKAALKLKLKQVPTMLYSELTDDERQEIIARDNVSNGEWDYDVMTVDPFWDGADFDMMGVPEQMPQDLPGDDDEPGDKPKKSNGKKKNQTDDDEEDEGDPEKEDFYRSMLKDVLYPANNKFDIPTLLLEMQASHLEMPLSPWGANSRLRKDVATYHFYVDDYRFEALFKDPVKLLMSGCKAIVEPNCSCHDQTPVAYGISLIYKKRWLARYFQECGVRVYADLNVSHKFIEYNKMGIPKGYNAFFTRGLDGWMESLKLDLQVAQEISGLETPNLIVYGGGDEIQDFCQKKGLLYVTDFINAKKK